MLLRRVFLRLRPPIMLLRRLALRLALRLFLRLDLRLFLRLDLRLFLRDIQTILLKTQTKKWKHDVEWNLSG
jgi:hypothetical protein